MVIIISVVIINSMTDPNVVITVDRALASGAPRAGFLGMTGKVSEAEAGAFLHLFRLGLECQRGLFLILERLGAVHILRHTDF